MFNGPGLACKSFIVSEGVVLIRLQRLHVSTEPKGTGDGDGGVGGGGGGFSLEMKRRQNQALNCYRHSTYPHKHTYTSIPLDCFCSFIVPPIVHRGTMFDIKSVEATKC